MKISIEHDRLVVRGWRGIKFNASAVEIVELRFIAEHTYYGPRLIKALLNLLDKYKIILRAAIVWTADKGTTLDCYRDKGFDDALEWLQEKGWDIGEGKRLAFSTPLVRRTVPRK